MDAYYGSSRRGTEETDVGSITDGDALVDLGCSYSGAPTALFLKVQIRWSI